MTLRGCPDCVVRAVREYQPGSSVDKYEQKLRLDPRGRRSGRRASWDAATPFCCKTQQKLANSVWQTDPRMEAR